MGLEAAKLGTEMVGMGLKATATLGHADLLWAAVHQ